MMGRYFFNNLGAEAARCRARLDPLALGPHIAVSKHCTQRYDKR
jgi:hypothetical protein